MEYRFLGNTGIKVSVLSFGNWLTSNNKEDVDRNVEIVKKAWEAGINFFDTAEGYGSGEGEIQFGRALKELNAKREEYVVSTKIFWGGKLNELGLNRKHVIEGTQRSLRRLGLDYVDVIFAHRYDHDTPIEEVCRAFNYVIEKGWAFYWGTSEWSAEQIRKAYTVCDKLGLIRPIAEQPQYNMLVRDRFEEEYKSLFEEERMGTTIWSPLCNGVLTGKYNDNIPEGSRFTNANPFVKSLFEKFLGNEDTRKEKTSMLKQLGELAKELECTQSQLAIAWLIWNKDVSSCILGCSSKAQLDENLGALQVVKKLTPEVLTRIEKILNNRPAPPFDWKFFKNFPNKR